MHKKRLLAAMLVASLVSGNLNGLGVDAASTTTKYYKTAKTCTFKDKKGIKKIVVNNKKKKIKTGVKSYKLRMTKAGKYKISVINKKGKTKKYVIYIDKEKPAINGVKNGNTYSDTVYFSYYDNVKVAKATLDNITLKKPKKLYGVKTTGTHKITVIDKAGNKTTKTFSIIKQENQTPAPSMPVATVTATAVAVTPTPVITATSTAATVTPTPTVAPTDLPRTDNPIKTTEPTKIPDNTKNPTKTNEPTVPPVTTMPTATPTVPPTKVPTQIPTQAPTNSPTMIPTATPTQVPTAVPTKNPTATPTQMPTPTPTQVPTATPTMVPIPTNTPTPTPEIVSVFYDLNGVTGNISEQKTVKNNEITVKGIGSISKNGYSFKGWSTTKNGKVQYKAGDTFTVSQNITLYAVWMKEDKNWLMDNFIYQLSGNNIILQQYKGSSNNPVLNKTYTIDGTQYTATISKNVFQNYYHKDTIQTVTFEKGFKFPNDCSHLFEGCSNLTKVTNFLDNQWGNKFDNITNLSYCFSECRKLESLTKKEIWIPDSVTDLDHAFYLCTNFSGYAYWNTNTSSLKNMNDAFHYCSSLKGVSTKIPNSVTTANSAFSYCETLTLLPSISEDTMLTNAQYMFADCYNATNISGGTSYIPKTLANTIYMYSRCSKLGKDFDCQIYFKKEYFSAPATQEECLGMFRSATYANKTAHLYIIFDSRLGYEYILLDKTQSTGDENISYSTTLKKWVMTF